MTLPIRVLVVDDSAFSRKAIIRMLSTDPDLQVVGQAADGLEALRLVDELGVDVVTLDLEMPGLDGLTTLERLRRHRRIPVVVLSGAAAAGAAITLQALDLGAFDVVAKPSGGPLSIHAVAQELVNQVRGAAGLAPLCESKVKPPRCTVCPEPSPAPRRAPGLVLIGISTGGPPALQHVIPRLPPDLPVPVVVLQHMPPGYTRALAERLNKQAAIAVKEAENGDRLLPGQVLVAPSGFQLSFERGPQGPVVAIAETCPVPSFYRPCIDFTFQEAARTFGEAVLAVVMTGMGHDGAAGLVSVKEAGGRCWSQDEATSTIYGMPRAAAETGCVDEIFPLPELATRLVASFAPAPGRRLV